MLALLAAAAVVASPAGSCLVADKGEVVVDRQTLDLGKGRHLEAVALARKGSDPSEASSSRAVIYSPNCHVAFAQEFEDSEATRFSKIALGKERILLLTTFRIGGSNCTYRHVVLRYTDDYSEGVSTLAPMDLSHSNMGGLYIGNLGRRGPGLVRWDELWEGAESHYEPHRYRVVTYTWKESRFVGPVVTTTKQKFDPSPDDVAKRLGLGFSDLTRPDRFGGC